MLGLLPNWSTELWVLVLLPGISAIFSVLKMMAKAMADVDQTEQLRANVIKLRRTYDERTRQLAAGQDVDPL